MIGHDQRNGRDRDYADAIRAALVHGVYSPRVLMRLTRLSSFQVNAGLRHLRRRKQVRWSVLRVRDRDLAVELVVEGDGDAS